MTLCQFRRRSRRAQLVFVLLNGTYLAQRRGARSEVKLYYLPDKGCGYFAEIGIDEARECFVVLRSFSSSVPLQEYIHSIQLPQEWILLH